jgi:4-hydroxy-tetrahydrodipicolinate synthase
MVTPFDESGDVDVATLRAEIRYLVDEAKVHGLAVCGSTGEGHTITREEFVQITTVACEEVAGEIPVVGGIIVNSTREGIARAQAVAHLELAALQVTPVHYLFRPSDEAMLQHFATLAGATRTPIIIYNVVPWTYLSPELLTQIIREVPGVIGVKQSAGDLKLMADLIMMLAGDGLVMAATDALLYAAYALGAAGSIAAILQAAPKLSVALWHAVKRGDHGRALHLHGQLLAIWNAIEGDNLPANVKTAMKLCGRPGGHPRSPMPASSAAQAAKIELAIQAERSAP